MMISLVSAISHECCSIGPRSEEHTSELQSRFDLVCRLLLEKKKTYILDSYLPKIHVSSPCARISVHSPYDRQFINVSAGLTCLSNHSSCLPSYLRTASYCLL